MSSKDNHLPVRLNVEDFVTVDRRAFLRVLGASAAIAAGSSLFSRSLWGMLGATQERWLYNGFRNTRSRWNLLAQQVPILRREFGPDPAVIAYRMDEWNGAVAARDRLFAAVEEAKLRNLVVVTGDVHYNCAGELKKNFADEKSETLGVEFIATSIASGGDGFDIGKRFKALLQQSPHFKFFNGQRGYVRHVVTPERWQADFQVLDKVGTRDGRLTLRKSFVVENGRPGLVEA